MLRRPLLLALVCLTVLVPDVLVLQSTWAGPADQSQLPALDPASTLLPATLVPPEPAGGGGAIPAGGQARTGVETLWRHIMCKDKTSYYQPVDATTTFAPGDSKAMSLMTAHVWQQVYTVWYYRHESAKAWIYYITITADVQSENDYYVWEYINIAGATPSIFYPWSWKVDIFVDASYQATDFFEITDGGLTRTVMCQSVDQSGNPVGERSTFVIGTDSKAYFYKRFDKMAYYNEAVDHSHSIRSEWYAPSGALYMTFEAFWPDYKNTDPNYDYWSWAYDNLDNLSIDSNTPTGVWTATLYIDQYYDSGTRWYGPFATIQFTIKTNDRSRWTVMAYLDGDNNLEGYAIAKFLSMSQVGSSSNVKVVAELDRRPGYDTSYGDWTGTKRFFITNGMTPTPANAAQDLGEQNMGDPNTLSAFIGWTVQNYPADQYFLILFNHGSGAVQMMQMTIENMTSLGILFDDTDQDALTTPELAQALSTGGATISVIYLDACTMGGLEVGYQIASYADVMVASEEVGWASIPDSVYSTFLTNLVSNPSMTPASLATVVVTTYADAWSSGSTKITCAAVDLAKFRSAGLVTASDTLAVRLQQKYGSYSSQIQNARSGTEGFEGPYAGNTGYYVDLYHFSDLVYNSVSDTDLRNAASDVKSNLAAAVIAFRQYNHPNAHGLSIFFPDTQSKYGTYRTTYRATSFAAVTNWDEWLDAYYAPPTTVTTTVTLTRTSTVRSTSYSFRTTTTTVTSYTSTSTSRSTIPTLTTVVLLPLTVTSTAQSTQYLTSILTTTVTSYTSTQTSTSTIPTTVALAPVTMTSTVQSRESLTSILTTTVTSYTGTQTSTSTIVAPTTVILVPSTITSTVQSIQYLTSILTQTVTSYTATTTSTSTSVVYTTVTASTGGAGAGASSALACLGFLSLLAVTVSRRVTGSKGWRIPGVRSATERRCSTS